MDMLGGWEESTRTNARGIFQGVVDNKIGVFGGLPGWS